MAAAAATATTATISTATASDSTACEFTQIGVSDVRTLIMLLGSPEPAVCAVVIEALTKYSDSSVKRRVQLLNFNIIRPLIELTLSKDISIKKAAVACVASVTELNETHQDMRRNDLMNALITTLSREDSVEIQDEAAFALANLAKDFSNKADIRKAGGIKALVKLLESQDPDVKKNSAMALSNLLDDFSNRAEIRYVQGIGPLLDLLTSEFREVQENALQSLIRCADDCKFMFSNIHTNTNRIEIRKLNGIRKLIDMISLDPTETHQLALQCLIGCLEEGSESANALADANGVVPLVRLVQSDESKLKHLAAVALAKASKAERNQHAARDAGALQQLCNNLQSNDVSVVSSSAMALAALAKAEMNQTELYKLNVVDMLFKLLTHDDMEIKREATAALSSLYLNGRSYTVLAFSLYLDTENLTLVSATAKIRAKVRGAEFTLAIIKLLSVEDFQTVVNASECLLNMAEDYANRMEIIKQGGILAMIAALDKPNPKTQASLCLSMARCLQEVDGQIVLAKQPGFKGLAKIVDLLGAKDASVCRNAAYALSNASQYEPNAIASCNAGALEQLISLSKEGVRKSAHFAADAIDKLLNHRNNHLLPENIITEPFYDIGYAGSNLDTIKTFPTLSELQAAPVDKRREVILIDRTQDPALASIISFVTDTLNGKPQRHQIRIIAAIVSKLMGGTVEPSQASEFGFRFRITELKLKLGCNVIPIGQINQGALYHRALLFKVICDHVGLTPCSLVRGDYNRAWNVVDLKRQTLTPKQVSQSKDKSSLPRSKQSAAPSVSAGMGSSLIGGVAATSSLQNSSVIENILQSIVLPEDDLSVIEEPAIVDLMFEPGKLLALGGLEAEHYQHI
eukprot:jgi/Hompol1/5249/HPOL_000662-RA